MFQSNRHVPRVPVPRTPSRPLSDGTPLRLSCPTPYLSYVLCAAHRLDLLMAMRGRDGRTPAMPPFC